MEISLPGREVACTLGLHPCHWPPHRWDAAQPEQQHGGGWAAILCAMWNQLCHALTGNGAATTEGDGRYTAQQRKHAVATVRGLIGRQCQAGILDLFLRAYPEVGKAVDSAAPQRTSQLEALLDRLGKRHQLDWRGTDPYFGSTPAGRTPRAAEEPAGPPWALFAEDWDVEPVDRLVAGKAGIQVVQSAWDVPEAAAMAGPEPSVPQALVTTTEEQVGPRPAQRVTVRMHRTVAGQEELRSFPAFLHQLAPRHAVQQKRETKTVQLVSGPETRVVILEAAAGTLHPELRKHLKDGHPRAAKNMLAAWAGMADPVPASPQDVFGVRQVTLHDGPGWRLHARVEQAHELHWLRASGVGGLYARPAGGGDAYKVIWQPPGDHLQAEALRRRHEVMRGFAGLAQGRSGLGARYVAGDEDAARTATGAPVGDRWQLQGLPPSVSSSDIEQILEALSWNATVLEDTKRVAGGLATVDVRAKDGPSEREIYLPHGTPRRAWLVLINPPMHQKKRTAAVGVPPTLHTAAQSWAAVAARAAGQTSGTAPRPAAGLNRAGSSPAPTTQASSQRRGAVTKATREADPWASASSAMEVDAGGRRPRPTAADSHAAKRQRNRDNKPLPGGAHLGTTPWPAAQPQPPRQPWQEEKEWWEDQQRRDDEEWGEEEWNAPTQRDSSSLDHRQEGDGGRTGRGPPGPGYEDHWVEDFPLAQPSPPAGQSHSTSAAPELRAHGCQRRGEAQKTAPQEPYEQFHDLIGQAKREIMEAVKGLLAETVLPQLQRMQPPNGTA